MRLTADECYSYIGLPEAGYNLDDGIKAARMLEEHGADAIDVSSAGYDTFNFWLEPVSFTPGWRKHFAKAIKDAVSIPVIAANLIRSPEQAEQQLKDGIQDMVSLGRPHIADPHWTNKVLSGKGTVQRCICCLNCIESMQTNAYRGSHGECSVNPFVGHEDEILVNNGKGRKIVIVGAGPAGLVAAKILADRGFSVTVFEKEAKAGGQLNLASAPPEKATIIRCALSTKSKSPRVAKLSSNFFSAFSMPSEVLNSGQRLEYSMVPPRLTIWDTLAVSRGRRYLCLITSGSLSVAAPKRPA